MNTLNNWKDGDVYRWSYNDIEYDKRKDYHDMYWCCSRIGIVRKTLLVDTYWSGSDSSRSFGQDDVLTKLDVEYLGNIKDYVSCNKYDQAMYADNDFLDISHANSGNQCFLKIGAIKSKDKMIKIVKRNALKLQADVERAKRSLSWELEKLDNLDELNYAYGLDGVELSDVSYTDEEFFKLEK